MFTPLTAAHRADYLRFAKAFYCSDAVEHPIPLSHMERTFDALAAGSPYLAGFLLTHQGAPAGYALLMKTWSQGVGGRALCGSRLPGTRPGRRFFKGAAGALPRRRRLSPGAGA